jgi:pyridoxal phosphate enzyme (YggS family)
MSELRENLDKIREDIAENCLKAGRKPEEVKLVAVSKNFPPEVVLEAYTLGQVVFGENRVQELLSKKAQLPGDIKWHLIGSLQRNKVKDIIGKVELIHSVDTVRLAQEISRQALKTGFDMPILIQVNISGEEAKHGFSSGEILRDIQEISELPGIKIKGLMTMAPQTNEPEEVRPVFRGLRKLSRDIADMNLPGVEMSELSMGMSDDYRIAIQEGATLVRIGSRIFGLRNYGHS